MPVMHSGSEYIVWLQGFEEYLQLWQEVRWIQPDSCNRTEYSFALSVAPWQLTTAAQLSCTTPIGMQMVDDGQMKQSLVKVLDWQAWTKFKNESSLPLVHCCTLWTGIAHRTRQLQRVAGMKPMAIRHKSFVLAIQLLWDQHDYALDPLILAHLCPRPLQGYS